MDKMGNIQDFLGKFVQIIHPKSKFNGLRGIIYPKLVSNNFKISIPPAIYDERKNNYVIYVEANNIYKWVMIVK